MKIPYQHTCRKCGCMDLIVVEVADVCPVCRRPRIYCDCPGRP